MGRFTITFEVTPEIHKAVTDLRNSMGTRNYRDLMLLALFDFAKRRIEQAETLKESVKPVKGMSKRDLDAFFDGVIAKYAPVRPYFGMFPDAAYDGLTVAVQHDEGGE